MDPTGKRLAAASPDTTVMRKSFHGLIALPTGYGFSRFGTVSREVR